MAGNTGFPPSSLADRQVYDLPTSMISLCQVGRGFPAALGRAPGSFFSLFIASRLSLSARLLRITQNQTSIRCIELFPTVTED